MSKNIDIQNKNFYNSISNKYSKYRIKKNNKTLKEICFPKKYEFQIPQLFLSEYINPNTPYKGILVFHKIGAGKTCAAIKISEKFKNKFNIKIVLPASLKGNFRSELRTQCAGNEYLTQSERDTLRTLHPSSDAYKNIIKKSDDRIDKVYTIYSYNKFIDLIHEQKMKLNNTLLIIDEIHNMISETGIYYETLHKIIHSAPDSLRLVLMSATPIFDKPIEIALTMNLLIKQKQLPTGSDFIRTFMDIKYTKKGPVYTVKNMDMFKKYIKGYVSYFRGAPPHIYPRSEVHLVKTKMSDLQLKIYSKITSIESKENSVVDFVNSNISNSFFIGTRMISNIVFPNGKIGDAGFKSMKEEDFEMRNIRQFSPKFSKIIRKINKCEGTVFVYSNFKEFGGVRTFVRLLENHNYKNYEFHGSGEKRFAIWSGDQTNEIKDEIKAVFNNKNNKNGNKIKVVIGSPSIKEGVSLLRVQEVHLIEPYWNFSRIEQIIGRAIRFCSHKDMPLKKQLVKVYIYISYHPEIDNSVDQHIMNMAYMKKGVRDEFEKALKEAAVDCELFKNANVYEGDEPIVCNKN